MKKLLVSLGAILTALPMAANAADPVPGDPGATSANAAVATAAPKYALVTSSSIDTALATAGYVKGAYNAAIKGVNKLKTDIDTATTNFNTAVQNMANSYATKSGVLATIDAAETSGSFTGAALQNGSFTGASLSDASVAGNATATISAVMSWGDESVTNLAGVTAELDGVTVSGTVGGTVTGTVSGTTAGTIEAPDNYVTGA